MLILESFGYTQGLISWRRFARRRGWVALKNEEWAKNAKKGLLC